jgi:lipopolysaccharide transport system permease protein
MIPSATTVISAERREQTRQFLKDVWDYRELFLTFLQRDLKVRYKQTALGVVWVVLQPLFVTGAFALIFGGIAGMPTDGLPVVLFYFAANVPWSGFSRALTGAAMSIEGNAHLVTKVYFPRVVIPAAYVTGSYVDFAVGWLLLNIVAALMGHWHWLLLAMTPLLALIQGLTALGWGLALAALNARYRDVRNAVGFIVQMLMLATPVIYPASRLPAAVHPFLFLNPMAALIEAYRASLKGGPFDWPLLTLSLLTAGLYVALGFWYFRRQEAQMADIL